MFGAAPGTSGNCACTCLDPHEHNEADRATARRIRADVAALRKQAECAAGLAKALRGVVEADEGDADWYAAKDHAIDTLAAYDAAKRGK